MSDCAQSPFEFVQDAFAPQVAVLCSHDAELVCKKNNLTFVELAQPFCRLTAEAHIRDPNGVAHSVRNLKVSMRDLNNGPPQPTLARKMLNDAVANALPAGFDLSKCEVATFRNYDLQLSANCPWFEAYRECFLHVLFPSDHEFLKHHLACIFIVSSSHANPMDQFQQLTQQQHTQQHQQPNKLPKWFCPNILRYYVLLHDVTHEQETKASSIYETMKNTYGQHNCHLLQVNSRVPGSADDQTGSQSAIPDPWSKFLPNVKLQEEVENSESTIDSALEVNDETTLQTPTSLDHPLAMNDESKVNESVQNHVTDHMDFNDTHNSMTSDPVWSQRGCCLSLSDHDRLRIFIHEFIVRGLIPWAERILRNINDQVLTKKGISRSLLSGAKKWFGGNKPAPHNQLVERPNVVYTSEAPEMQMRRLADMSFMFQLYETAYQTYHQCKRDFNNDHAWLHYAGAMEMAAMSILMQASSNQRQYPTHYMEQAINTYLAPCKLPNLATRATLLNCEALKSKQLYNEAAVQYIKMTSEDSDLRSALLLEQAAHCFLRLKQPMPRKYSFHMILAGHRFSKAGQRRHALRTYAQALQTYKSKGWSLAEDHINFTIGRQSFNLKQLENATLAFKHLLAGPSKQPVPQQHAFLREYLFVLKQLEAQKIGSELYQLPLPVVDGNATKVLCCHPHTARENKLSATSCTFAADTTSSDSWRKLEELVVVDIQGSLPPMHKPSVQCYSESTDNTSHPVAVIGELLSLEVHLVNPLKVALSLSDVTLLWRFLPVHYDDEDSPAHAVSNEKQISKNPMVVPEQIVETQSIPELTLQASECKKVQLTLRPMQTGELHVTGLGYQLGGCATQPENQSNSVSSITVRGKLNLECQGPRLNKTKEERAGRKYGVDSRLDLVIVPQMPRLEVHFCDFPQSLLQGEIRRILVEFTNCGKAPLSRLKLACTNPEMFSFSRTSSQNSAQNEVTSLSMTPDTLVTSSSGTDLDSIQNTTPSEIIVARPTIKFVQTVPLDKPVLHPGETATVEMWICAPTHFGESSGAATGLNLTREYETQMLFYYEAETKHPRSKLRHRVLRHTVQLQIRPSLMLRVLASRRHHYRQSCDQTFESHDGSSTNSERTAVLKSLLLSLCVQNINNDTEWAGFRVSHVRAVSDAWRLQRLTHHGNDTDIGKGESALMSFHADQSAHAPSQKEAIISDVSFTSPRDLLSTPSADFYFRSQHPVTFDEVDVEPQKPALLPDDTGPPSKTSLIKDIDKLRLSLIVVWKACCNDGKGEGHVFQGQHHVTLTEQGKMTYNPPSQLKQLEQPPVRFVKQPEVSSQNELTENQLSQLLQYSLSYSHHVQHDFTRQRMCRVEVEVQCLNISPVDLCVQLETRPADRFDVQAQNQETSANTTSGETQPPEPVVKRTRHLGSFLWTSQQVSSFNVATHANSRVTLTACFCKPGVYNIATLQVKAKPSVDLENGVKLDMTLQRSPTPCLIVISDSRNTCVTLR